MTRQENPAPKEPTSQQQVQTQSSEQAQNSNQQVTKPRAYNTRAVLATIDVPDDPVKRSVERSDTES
ncbi:MAG: hypothetical protein U9R79_12700 [Armatimonadota bacterium]|nr:hypothetical protein [Armatimonadota bacterium]